jgi:ketosteroid isomerase-like protein
MKKTILFAVCTASVMMFASCKDAEKTETPAETPAAMPEAPKTDPAQVRTAIQAVETAWADAVNKKDINALMALYAEGAQSMQDGAATLNGKADIQKQQEADFAAPRKWTTIAFETTDVYAEGDYATEVGKTMYKDEAGKTTGSGKYMVVYVKQDGKYLCLREIYNRDTK